MYFYSVKKTKMDKIPKIDKKVDVIELIIVTSILLSAFYLFYSNEIDVYLKKLYNNNLNNNDENNLIEFSDKPRTEIDQSIYEGRKEFCSNINPEKCIRGFELPNDINALKFIDGKISIITKPNTNLFLGLPQMAFVQLSRDGNDLIYEGSINGVRGVFRENYQKIKENAILPTNSFLIL